MNYYQHYQLSPKNGFLPDIPPLKKFSSADLQPLDELAAAFSGMLNAACFRRELLQFPELEVAAIEDKAALERAQLLYACFAHGFVWEGGISSGYLPQNLVRPWLKICQKLQRKPILMHSSLVLNNWQLIDPKKGITLDNIATLIQFYGGLDESWFYLLTTELEAIGSPLVNLAVNLMEKQYQIAPAERAAILVLVAETIEQIIACLRRMYENCDPYIFYTRVRPFLASFQVIDYQGSGDSQPRNYFGGSAGQSALIQLIDALLGIQHKEQHSSYYLKEMRNYMPIPHRDFLLEIEQHSPLASWANATTELRLLYNNCIEKTKDFRQVHLEIVATYIMGQNSKKGPGQTGTGGTNPMLFLKASKKDTMDAMKE